jgi:hypothetical protein
MVGEIDYAVNMFTKKHSPSKPFIFGAAFDPNLEAR